MIRSAVAAETRCITVCRALGLTRLHPMVESRHPALMRCATSGLHQHPLHSGLKNRRGLGCGRCLLPRPASTARAPFRAEDNRTSSQHCMATKNRDISSGARRTGRSLWHTYRSWRGCRMQWQNQDEFTPGGVLGKTRCRFFFLINRGSDVTCQTKDKSTPLCLVTQEGQVVATGHDH